MRWIVLALVAVALSACAAVQPAASDQSIPWRALPADLAPPPIPSPQGMPVPPGTPACNAGELMGAVIGNNGATGHVITSFGFSTSAKSSCYLDGIPSVALLDASGKDLGFRQHASYVPTMVSGPALVDPGPRPEGHQGLKFGEAGLNIDWVTQPEGCLGQGGFAVATAGIRLSTGTISIPIPTEPAGYACQGVGVSSFEGPAMPVPATTPPPLPAIAVNAPSSAKAGERFEYTVTLTNDTDAPVDFVANCPNYEEELFSAGGFPLGGKHFYKLNCAPAGTLGVGKSARFQMILFVPPDAAAGEYRLVFMLGFWNAMTKLSVERPVRIR